MMGNLDRRLTGWTDERIAQLKELWESRLSLAEIASALGGVTRNAVCGKIHRLGLNTPHVKLEKPKPKPHKSGFTAPKTTRHGHSAGQSLPPQPMPKELSPDAIPKAQRKTLFELTNETCRFPYGDPLETSFFFCGCEEADLIAGHPYCRFHERLSVARTVSPTIVGGMD